MPGAGSSRILMDTSIAEDTYLRIEEPLRESIQLPTRENERGADQKAPVA